jgi:hypothetical protein
LADFPAVVLADVASEMRPQLGAYAILPPPLRAVSGVPQLPVYSVPNLTSKLRTPSGAGMCRSGSFNLQGGLEGFLAAYAIALATDQAFNVDLVYHALVKAISASMSDPAASRCHICYPVTGAIITTWVAFESEITVITYLRRDAEAEISGGQVFTRDELASLVRRLTLFRRAQACHHRQASESGAVGAAGLRGGACRHRC